MKKRGGMGVEEATIQTGEGREAEKSGDFLKREQG